MTTKPLLMAVALFGIFALGTPGQASRNDLPKLFHEDTLLYAEIPSVSQLQEDWEDNPFYELYQREDVKAFIDSFLNVFKSRNGLGFGEESGVVEDEDDKAILEELFKGQIVLGVSRLDFLSFLPNPMDRNASTNSVKPSMPDFWFAAFYDNEDLLQKMIDEMEEDEDEFIEYDGFYIITGGEMVECFNHETFAVTNTEETAKQFVDRYQDRSNRPSLADRENFQKGFLRLYENSELFYYLDLSFIAEVAEEAASEYEEAYLPMVEQGQLAPPATILEALGLDAFQALSGSIDLDPDKQQFRSLLMIESNDGFFGRMMGHYGNSLPDISFLGEDLSQAMATSFDISGMLRDLEHTVAAVSPMAGQLYLAQKSQFEQMLSIQIDQSLINNFSGSLYIASGETPNTAASALADQLQGMESILDQGSTYILGINDRVALEALLDSLLATFNQQSRILKQDFLGVSNYNMIGPGPSLGPSVFISDQHLIFEQTNPDFAKLVVSMMRNPGEPIFEQRDVRDALNELPPDPIGVTYTDAQKMLVTATGMLRKAWPLMAQHARQEAEAAGDPEAVPMDLKQDIPIIDDFSYFSISTTYKEDDDLYQEGILRPKSN